MSVECVSLEKDNAVQALPRWSEFQKRVVSSAVILPVAAFCLWYGRWAYDALILLVMAGLTWEGETLLKENMRSLRGVLLLLWPVCVGLVFIKGQVVIAFFLGLAVLLFGLRAYGPVFFAMLGGVALLWLRCRPYGMAEVLFVLAIVIASDSCAYLMGRLLGGPKLVPSISPGKTVSGACGGLSGALLSGSVVAYIMLGHVSMMTCFWTVLLGLSAQFGDLAESFFKRRLGVKDSGYLIPGHGGLLDRFDGLLAAAPLAALLALLAGRIPFWTLLGS